MKLFIALMFLSSIVYASPLDILDASGGFDARFGQEHFAADNVTTSNISINVSQGVRFKRAPWIEPYVGFNKAQALYILGGNTESLYGGVRNKTFLPPLQFGIEYKSTIVPEDPSVKSIVGYISVSHDWNLIGQGESK